MPRRRTKILATLGPATDGAAAIAALIEAGVDGVRINCSHGTPREWRRWVRQARSAARDAERPIAVVFDLQGPKIRLAAATPTRAFVPGDRTVLVAGDDAPDGGLACPSPEAVASIDPDRSEVVIGDGTPRFAVERVTGRGATRRAHLRCVRAGSVGARKGLLVTFPRRRNHPALTSKDLDDLAVACACRADFVALSYVRRAGDVEQLRARLAHCRSTARVIAKIETISAMEHLDEIVAVADAVMVARGDLGVEAGVAQVPIMQRTIAHACARVGRLSIMATQMLESMVTAAEPTRAEATDIATAVIQGASVLMLSAETTVGRFPAESVRAMADIAYVAEAQESSAPPPAPAASEAESVMRAAAALGEAVGAAAYVVPTSSGASARTLAAQRPRAPIVALTHRPSVANQLALERGVVPAVLPAVRTLDETIERSVGRARELVGIALGAPVVITSGMAVGASGGTSLIALRHVGDGGIRTARPPVASPRR